MATIIMTDMYFTENKKHFDLQELRRLESIDMTKIKEKLRSEEDLTKAKIQKEVLRVLKSSKERSKLESIKYFNKHVFKLSDELQIFLGGSLITISLKDFEATYIKKCDFLIDTYFNKELDIIYDHIIDPFNYQRIIRKKIDEKNKYYINDIDPPRFKYNENHEKNNKFVETYKDIIKNVICRKNDKFFEWVWLYFASIIQGYKLQSVMYIYGVQGCGKSWTINVLAYMLGKRFIPVCLNDLGQFNMGIYGKILLNLDETKDNSNFTSNCQREALATQFIKKITTSNTARLEEKYMKRRECEITCNTVITSNHLLIDKRELAQRRWAMALCYNEYDEKFWNTMKQYLTNPIEYEADYYALFCELMETDVSKFINNSQNMYSALNLEIKETLMADSLPNTALYLKQLAIDSLKNKQLAKENFTKFTRIKFREDCNSYLIQNGLNTVKRDTIEETMNELKIGCQTNTKTKQVYYKCTNEELINKLIERKYITNEELADINAGGKLLLTKSNIINDEEEERKKKFAQQLFDDQKDKIEEQEDEIQKLKKEIEELKSKLNEKEEVKEEIKSAEFRDISTGKMIFEGKLLKNLCDIAQKHEEIIFD